MSLLIYGTIHSAILAFYAVGFSLVYGISGVANFVHGGFYILSGYLAWCLINYLGLPLFISVPGTIFLMVIIGFLFYWVFLLRVRGNILAEVVVTFAAGVAILEFLSWLGVYGVSYNLPVLVSGGIEIGNVNVDYQRLVVLGTGVILSILLWLFIHHTKTGLAFRGIAQDERTALSLGIDSDWTGALSVGFGAALTAIAAMIILPMGALDAHIGHRVLIYAIAICILGGLESILGMVIASFIIGFGEIIVAEYISSNWMVIVPLASIILILATRPSGLLGKSKDIEERV